MKTRIGITSGELKGIGSEIILKILADTSFTESFELIPVIDKNIITSLSAESGIKINKDFEFIAPEITAGDDYSLSSLKKSLSLLKENRIDALVTMPILKNSLKGYSGHTEFLEDFDGRQSAMMMCGKAFRCILITNHLPVRKIADEITSDLIVRKIEMGYESLKNDFGISSPKIAVLSLNPHGGEDGLLGNEENDIILPAIKNLNEKNIDAHGAFPSDGFFSENSFENYDLTAGMYHDQILTPFKYINGDSGVNFTAGLSFVRTSPAHGTALDIAGKFTAREESSKQAIILADKIFKNRKKQNG